MMPFELMVTLAAVFISIALVSGSVASFVLARTSPELKRLRKVTRQGPPPGAGGLSPNAGDASDPHATSKPLRRSGQERTRLHRRLASAGYDAPGAATLYSTAQLVLPIVFCAIPVLALGLRTGWLLGVLAAIIGWMIPDLVLGRRTSRHRKAIQDGLPDALDLLVVCVEAGSSLDQAILRASEELEIAVPAIARELRSVATEIRAGKPRLEAFQNFARRTNIADVRALVAMLIHTDRFGTSIAQALRTHAHTSRTKRRQGAEERASTVGVKLVFPLVLCLLPALYVVCLGPVAVRMYRVF